VQALHVGIPVFARHLTDPKREVTLQSDPNDRFSEAVKAADAALRRIAGRV